MVNSLPNEDNESDTKLALHNEATAIMGFSVCAERPWKGEGAKKLLKLEGSIPQKLVFLALPQCSRMVAYWGPILGDSPLITLCDWTDDVVHCTI